MGSISIGRVLQASYQKIEPIDARLLLQHVLNENQAFLHTHPNCILTSLQEQTFSQLVARRLYGEPVAYLLGEREFYDLTFKVTSAVLIPRPETELLVDLALERLPADQIYRVLDLGTGSGAIALTIAKHRPQVKVVAVDISADAAAIAKLNTERLGVNNVSIVVGSWFDALGGEKFDLIVSNPPYVAESDPHLRQGDLRFEPQLALAAESDGLACLREIISVSPDYLVVGGWLLIEHGYDQAVNCSQLFKIAGFDRIFSSPDLAGIMRVSGGKRS